MFAKTHTVYFIVHVYSVETQSTDTDYDRQGHDRQGLAQFSTLGTYKCLSKTHKYYYTLYIYTPIHYHYSLAEEDTCKCPQCVY